MCKHAEDVVVEILVGGAAKVDEGRDKCYQNPDYQLVNFTFTTQDGRPCDADLSVLLKYGDPPPLIYAKS